MIDEASAKLFAPFATPEHWRAAERGERFNELWDAVASSGFLDVLCTDGEDAADAGAAAFRILRNAGRTLIPAPIGETIVARAVFHEAGRKPPPGPLALGATRAAYGRYASEGLCGDGDVRPAKRIAILQEDTNAAGEPRDNLRLEPDGAAVPAWTSARLEGAGALVRASQISGALERVLMLTVDYARTRKQFGKPIGQFQAIQQQLAILAGQTASASVAAAHAFRRWGHQDFVMLAAAAKIRCGEAAGAAISIAHQTHGAIGITYEHELHFATRRLHAWRGEFGSEAYWAGRLGSWAVALGAEQMWARITNS
jgi:acyl-CoA dehydrogenase